MRRSKHFFNIMLADFLARSAYQMGKTPLLPIFATTLGASGAFLGFIVSISTMTGLFLKPLFGVLSDRWGRRIWLIVGTCFFAFMPFFYGLVETSEHLLLIRLIHGLATAIYGPVTLAYIAELSKGKQVAEDIGWFEMARSGGYIAGPALAGWLLLSISPVEVFTIIGIISCLVFIPVLQLPETRSTHQRKFKPIFQHIKNAIRDGSRTPAIWMTGSLESITFIVLYTLKVFLPIFALEAGVSIVLVGLYFSLQEAVHIITKPFCGRLGDRWGHLPTITLGMVILSVSLPLVTSFDNGLLFLIPGMMMGFAQALIFPSAIALVSNLIDAENLGTGMGLIGMMQNFGKVVGPILGGFAIQNLGYQATLYLLTVLLIVGIVIIWQIFLPRPSLMIQSKE